MQAHLLQPVIVELTAAATIRRKLAANVSIRMRPIHNRAAAWYMGAKGHRLGTDVGGGNFKSVASAPQSSGHSPAPQASSAPLAAVSAK
jgi:hypothetical protein